MKKAFTLIELLVTIVIIGLLLAILFPALGRVREGARRVQCMNNLRQHGIAWYLYLDDHDECFPAYGMPSAGGANEYSFGGKQGIYPPTYGTQYRVLNNYLDIDSAGDKAALEIFHCPDDVKSWLGYPKQIVFDLFGNSYRLNSRILILGSFGNRKSRPLSTITSPRNKVFLEMCNSQNNPGHGGKGLTDWKVMVLFVDGHVAGTFVNGDFELVDPNTDKPIISDPNGTWGAND